MQTQLRKLNFMRSPGFLSFVFAVLLCACNNRSNNTAINNPGVIKQGDTMHATLIIEDTLRIPSDTAYEQSILVSDMLLHGDQVPLDAESQDWYGLFKSGNHYYVDSAKIKIETYWDMIVDPGDSSEKTGKFVYTYHKDTALLLISKTSLPQNYITENLIKPQRFIYPQEDTITFKSHGLIYKLYASGVWGLSEHYSDTGYFNYRLYLSGIKDGKVINQLLVATPHLQFETIDFIGDIDGDGIPDIIFDLGVEDASVPTLYLSRNAGANTLLKVVAQSIYTGC